MSISNSRNCSPYKIVAALALILFALVAWVVYAFWKMNETGPPVRFLVLTGFRGRIRVVSDPKTPPVPLVNGEYRIQVPADGYVLVHDTDYQNAWHEEIVEFGDGSTARYEDDDKPEQVAIRDGRQWGPNSEPDERGYWTGMDLFVGTKKECQSWQGSPDIWMKHQRENSLHLK